jgi:hypothetical protein
MKLTLVTHDKSGAGYALQESDGRWIVRFFHNYARHHEFTQHAFTQGYLKNCGIVDIGD